MLENPENTKENHEHTHPESTTVIRTGSGIRCVYSRVFIPALAAVTRAKTRVARGGPYAEDLKELSAGKPKTDPSPVGVFLHAPFTQNSASYDAIRKYQPTLRGCLRRYQGSVNTQLCICFRNEFQGKTKHNSITVIRSKCPGDFCGTKALCTISSLARNASRHCCSSSWCFVPFSSLPEIPAVSRVHLFIPSLAFVTTDFSQTRRTNIKGLRGQSSTSRAASCWILRTSTQHGCR